MSILTVRRTSWWLTAVAVLALLLALLGPALLPRSASAKQTGRIQVFKTLVQDIGQQDTPMNRDTTLAGFMIDFQIFAGTGTTGELVDTVTVTLGRNANGEGNVGNGSQGFALSEELTPGTFTVCEVEVARGPNGETVTLNAEPRPEAGNGGSTGGTNQEQLGDNCIVVELTPGIAELQFLDEVVEQTTPPDNQQEEKGTPTPTVPADNQQEDTGAGDEQDDNTGNIAVFKTLCEDIGQQDTCMGRDTSLAGFEIDFQIFEGEGTTGELVDTVTVTLGRNANGEGNVGNGSQGFALSEELTPGTFTVCEVEVARGPNGETVTLNAEPRPEAGNGGSTGGTNQEQLGDNCIVVELTPGIAELQFLDEVVEQTTPPDNQQEEKGTPTPTVPADNQQEETGAGDEQDDKQDDTGSGEMPDNQQEDTGAGDEQDDQQEEVDVPSQMPSTGAGGAIPAAGAGIMSLAGIAAMAGALFTRRKR